MCRFYNLDFVFYNEKGTEISALFFCQFCFLFINYLCASWSRSSRSSLGDRAPVLLKDG